MIMSPEELLNQFNNRTSPLNWDILSLDVDYEFDITTNHRIRTVDFGNGYSQEVVEGVNNIRRTYSLSFTNRPLKLLNLGKYFLDLHASVHHFLFEDPDTNENINGVGKDVSLTKMGIGLGTLSFNFTERFSTESIRT